MDAQGALKEYFGHKAFRPGQEAIIAELLAGRDVLGVMPTGAGKSVCYQIPALLLEGLTLVVSPLISLMKDQVAALTQAGIPAAYLNSSLTFAQYQKVLQRLEEGRYRILYVAPERLTVGDFLQTLRHNPLALVAVDEAHCVSQWGQDFRPSYLKIVEFLQALPQRPPVGAFTATATQQVKEDIIRLLGLRSPYALTTGFDRPNLYFGVEKPKDKTAYLRTFLNKRPDKSGIVYCSTRKQVDGVYEALSLWGIPAARYHAGMSDEDRRRNQDEFVYDQARVMVATNAFGMGIDKSNVSFVLHYNMPKNLESYYQEAGRAGRDGEAAECVLLYAGGDVQTAKFLIRNARENEALTGEEQEAVMARELDRLEHMIHYCRTTDCLRGVILGYFGETHGDDCGNCGNCVGNFVREDITVEAQKILSCVARVEKKHPYGLGANLIIATLRGSRAKRILQLGLDQISTYGLLSLRSLEEVQGYIDLLLAEGYLMQSVGEYPVLGLGSRAGDVLFRGAKVTRKIRRREEVPPVARKPLSVDIPEEAEELLDALKKLRSKLAQREGVPAYIIFSNATLVDMARRRPQTQWELLEVAGVGQVKAQRYGQAFLELLQAYVQGDLSAEALSDAPKPTRGGVKWTPEEEAQIALQFQEGASVEEIARNQSRSPKGVYARLVKLELIREDDP